MRIPHTYAKMQWSKSTTYRPRREGRISHIAPDEAQLLQGCTSVTLHRTRRLLHSRHACLARVFFGLGPADDDDEAPVTDGMAPWRYRGADDLDKMYVPLAGDWSSAALVR